MKKFFLFTFFITLIISEIHVFSDSRPVTIYLKIFHKRNEIRIVNGQGFYLNGTRSNQTTLLILEKADGLILCNGSKYSSLRLRPVRKSLTTMITKYGEKKYDGSFIITLKNRKFFVLNKTSMRSYLLGVVSSELGEGFSLETLKAQAVASRTYFLYLKNKYRDRPYDIIDLAGGSQAYRGLQLAGKKSRQALKETENEILRGSQGFIPYFHSTCGGMLLSAEESWGSNNPGTDNIRRRYDGSLEKPHCRISPYFSWTLDVKKSMVHGALEKQLKLREKISRLSFFFKDRGFLDRITIFSEYNSTMNIKGFRFKSLLEKEGISGLRSARLSVRDNGREYAFQGWGFGHFVGMCQWGAEFLARKGMSYRKILHFYYPDAVIHNRF